ncbi:MAG: hypothetical protein KDC95_09355 [Planctomycetes bacterium]|nr:hypothetical protein [Planctomycetota bacterium]
MVEKKNATHDDARLRPEFTRAVQPAFRVPRHLRRLLQAIEEVPSEQSLRDAIRVANDVTLERARARRDCGAAGQPILEIDEEESGGENATRKYDPIRVINRDCNAAENAVGSGFGIGIAQTRAAAEQAAKDEAERDARARMNALVPVCLPPCPHVAPPGPQGTVTGTTVILALQAAIVIELTITIDGRRVTLVTTLMVWIAVAKADWEWFFVCSDQAWG